VTPTEHRWQLEQELCDAGIAYASHAAPGQRPQATFRYAEGHGPTLPFTVTIRNGALQLQVHDLSPPSDPAGAAALNIGWGVGQACYLEQHRSYRLTSGYPVFARRPGRPLLPLLIASLYAVGATLSLPGNAAWSDAREMTDTMRSAFLQCDAPAVMRAMELAVRGIGHPFQRVGDASLRQLFREPDGNAFAVTIAPRDTRFIRVETRVAPGTDPGRLDWLNEAAPIGCFVTAETSGEVVHAWEFPGEFISVTERLAAWLVEVGAQMSAVAKRIPPAA
jgi:hypothetical protein